MAVFAHLAATRSGKARIAEENAATEKINAPYASRVLRLTLRAPTIVEAILDGRQPVAITLAALKRPFPVGWSEQIDVNYFSGRFAASAPPRFRG